jgi:dihydrofolate synthase/folylpolyglutamate synthase
MQRTPASASRSAPVPHYPDAERWLRAREPLGMRFGLERMKALMEALGAPQLRFRSIHVVGTNGKSSTVRMIAALLERHGVRTGAYLSPHLLSFAERVEVAERPVELRRFAAAVQRVATAVEQVDAERALDDRVTQFEALTAAAYVEFACSGVDVAVVEAGLGGRFDATNVIPSAVQVLTNVGLEHTALLGSTHAEIAAEKLAVVPENGVLVIGSDLHPDAERLARETSRRTRARLVRAAAPSVVPAAPGAFQRRNFALAEAAARGFLGTLDPAAVRRAAAAVRVPGRLQIVDREPLTVFDAAHNPHGVAALVDALPELGVAAGLPTGARVRPVAVLSILGDKDARGMLRALLPHCAAVVATSNSDPRARSAPALAGLIAGLGFAVAAVEPDPRVALARARSLVPPDGVVLAAGSICLIGDLVGSAALGPHAPAATSAAAGRARQARGAHRTVVPTARV